MEKNLSIYFDKEADFLEVIFEIGEGYFKDTENENVMEKVGTNGRILGFSIFNVSCFSELPISINLHAA